MRSFAYACLIAATASTAFAAPKPKDEAKRRIDRAAALHKQGKFDDALAELEAAYKLDPQVDLLFSIGQVYAKLGRCDEAHAKFEEFAAKKKSKEASAIVEQAVAACIPKAPAVPPPAAAPPVAPAASPPVVVASPMPEPEKPAQPAPTAPAEPPPAPTFATATSQPAPAPPATVASPRAWYRDALGDGLVLAGIAAVVIGGIEYHAATSDLDNAESAGSLARYDQLVDDAHGKRTISVVLFAGGAALVGAGIVRYALHDRGRERASIAVAPAPGGGLVTIRGGF